MKIIDANRSYRLPEAAALLPSERIAGLSMHPQTLRKLIRLGRISATRRPGGRFWWIRGSELLRYLRETEPPMVPLTTPPHELEMLRSMGVRV